jgi:hypothetical protein
MFLFDPSNPFLSVQIISTTVCSANILPKVTVTRLIGRGERFRRPSDDSFKSRERFGGTKFLHYAPKFKIEMVQFDKTIPNNQDFLSSSSCSFCWHIARSILDLLLLFLHLFGDLPLGLLQCGLWFLTILDSRSSVILVPLSAAPTFLSQFLCFFAYLEGCVLLLSRVF